MRIKLERKHWIAAAATTAIIVAAITATVNSTPTTNSPTATPTASGQWYDNCPACPVHPIQPTHTPEPTPTCRPCVSPTPYPASTPYPPQPTLDPHLPTPTRTPSPTPGPPPSDLPLSFPVHTAAGVTYFNSIAQSGDIAAVPLAHLDLLNHVTGGHRGVLAFSMANAQEHIQFIADNASVLIYNPEHWELTPPDEQNNLVEVNCQGYDLAHHHDLSYIVAPDQRFSADYAAALALCADTYFIMAQRKQANPNEFAAYVRSVAVTVRAANPDIRVYAIVAAVWGPADEMYAAIQAVEDDIDGIFVWSMPSSFDVLQEFVTLLRPLTPPQPTTLPPSPTPSPTPAPPTAIPTGQPSGRILKYYGMDTVQPADFALLTQYHINTVFVALDAGGSEAEWATYLDEAERHNLMVMVWPLGGGGACGLPYDGTDISQVYRLLDYLATKDNFVAILNAHEPFWSCPMTVEEMATIKINIKTYVMQNHGGEIEVFNHIDNLDDHFFQHAEPADIGLIMDVAGVWKHPFNGEGSCEYMVERTVADRQAIQDAGFEEDVDLVLLFQTFGMSRYNYRMPTAAEMQEWACTVLQTNALDGFFWYTWDNPSSYSEHLSQDRYDANQEDRWEVIRYVWENCANQSLAPESPTTE